MKIHFAAWVSLSVAMMAWDTAFSTVFNDDLQEFAYTDENPQYLDIQEVELEKMGSKTIRFKVRFAQDLPVASSIRQVLYVYLDVDNNASTGQKSSYDNGFGYDYSFSLARPPKQQRFKVTGSDTYGNATRSPNEIKVDRITHNKNELVFDVETKIFLKAEKIKFNVSSAVAVMDDLHKDEILSRESLDRLGSSSAQTFELRPE